MKFYDQRHSNLDVLTFIKSIFRRLDFSALRVFCVVTRLTVYHALSIIKMWFQTIFHLSFALRVSLAQNQVDASPSVANTGCREIWAIFVFRFYDFCIFRRLSDLRWISHLKFRTLKMCQISSTLSRRSLSLWMRWRVYQVGRHEIFTMS